MTTYQIKVKRDWGRYGWYDAATRTCGNRGGFVVTDGICNIIPGACWFKTIEDAMVGIEAHKLVGDTQAWHATYRRLDAERRERQNMMEGV